MLSQQSIMISWFLINSSAFSLVKRFVIAVQTKDELISRALFFKDSAYLFTNCQINTLNTLFLAASSEWPICLWMLLISTISSSTIVIVPMHLKFIKRSYQYHFQQDKEQQGILIHLHLLLKLLHYWSFSNNKNRIQIHACPSIPTLSSRICLEYRSFQSESGAGRFSDKRGLSLSIKEKCIRNNEES